MSESKVATLHGCRIVSASPAMNVTACHWYVPYVLSVSWPFGLIYQCNFARSIPTLHPTTVVRQTLTHSKGHKSVVFPELSISIKEILRVKLSRVLPVVRVSVGVVQVGQQPGSCRRVTISLANSGLSLVWWQDVIKKNVE